MTGIHQVKGCCVKEHFWASPPVWWKVFQAVERMWHLCWIESQRLSPWTNTIFHCSEEISSDYRVVRVLGRAGLNTIKQFLSESLSVYYRCIHHNTCLPDPNLISLNGGQEFWFWIGPELNVKEPLFIGYSSSSTRFHVLQKQWTLGKVVSEVRSCYEVIDAIENLRLSFPAPQFVFFVW